MIVLTLAIVSLLLAGIPCALFIANLREYRRLPANGKSTASVSVLIPARDEEANITAALESILRAEDVELEVIVLDDHSSDGTAAAVAEFAGRDPRVRLVSGESLPANWCGKNFACQQLANAARHPVLIFMDADVRVASRHSLARLAGFLEESGAALVSGVPRQETRTWLEKLIIPLIHFVLLGFLPLRRMRETADPRFAAACGQILAVNADAYRTTGGHAAVANRIHDAVALTRNMRAHGHRTDLFDATDTFHCRMYSSAAQVWNGFAKNAHEGIGSRTLIVPATLLLLGGQVLPFLMAATCHGAAAWIAGAAAMAALLPRLLAAKAFNQPRFFLFLHPLSITLLVAIQWYALLRRTFHSEITWKARAVSPVTQLATTSDLPKTS